MSGAGTEVKMNLPKCRAQVSIRTEFTDVSSTGIELLRNNIGVFGSVSGMYRAARIG